MVPVEAGQDQSANVALREVVIEAFLNLLRCDVVALRHVRINNDGLVSGPNCGQRPLPYVKREDIHRHSSFKRKNRLDACPRVAGKAHDCSFARS